MRNKYRNIKTTIDGILFDSKKEAVRYQQLKLLEKAGEITELKLQPSFDFIINGKLLKNGNRKITYKADFQYKENGKVIIEDVKGIKTPVYKIKKGLMMSVHGIDIRET